MASDNGGPAFPVPMGVHWGGMTLRDYFAGQALAGFASALFREHRPPPAELAESYAAAAYEMADAMVRKARGEE